MNITWREAVKEVCQAAGFSQAALAEEADLWPMTLTRHLRKANVQGAYTPDAKRVHDINHAAALLAGFPEIEPYLNALAVFDGLLAPQNGDMADTGFFTELVAEFDPYFEGGAERAILEAAAPLDRSARWDIARKCAVLRGREVVRRLAGKPPKSAGLAEFLALFQEAGAPIGHALRRNEALLRRWVRDRFELRVCEEIAAIDGASPAAPLKAARAILNAFDEALDGALGQNFSVGLLRGDIEPPSPPRIATHVRRQRKAGKEKNSE